ncbi:hypothetical protein [Ruminococcus sp.]|jgi:hypothetical protein
MKKVLDRLDKKCIEISRYNKLQDGITVSKFLSLCVEKLLMNEGF